MHQDIDKRNVVAQWAFDTRPVLLRFHLWLEDVEVERAQQGPVSAFSFTPRGIARCLAVTSAATALGTRLFGGFGEPTAHPRIMKLQRRTLINGRINPVLERLQPICYHDSAHADLFRNRRALREVLHEVIPTVGPFDDEPEF